MQEKVAVGQRREVAGDIAEVDEDHAVVLLSRGAAMLAFDADGLVAFFRVGGFVDDDDGVFVAVVASDNLAFFSRDLILVPVVFSEEILQGAGRYVGVEGDVFGDSSEETATGKTLLLSRTRSGRRRMPFLACAVPH